MQLHNVEGKKKRKKRVGRGGKRGTFSGRGTKGQRARAGHRIRPQLRDVLKKIPKKRGYRFTAFRARPVIVQIAALERGFEEGATVSPKALVEKGIIKKAGGNVPKVKVLGGGEITKKLIVEGCDLSATAKQKIEKVGGSIKKYEV